MSSRDPLNLARWLAPKFRLWMANCGAKGLSPLVTCTWRSPEEQKALYAQGRTAPGKIVTWTLESRHTETTDGRPASTAWDFVPLRHGKPVWDADAPEWEAIGAEAEAIGLEWGGRWARPDKPHIQCKR